MISEHDLGWMGGRWAGWGHPAQPARFWSYLFFSPLRCARWKREAGQIVAGDHEIGKMIHIPLGEPTW